MAKKVKMVIYGLPGVGKSTFASKTPNPLFICTDGNAEWLDLPDKNHVRVSTWKQAKEVINNLVLNKPEFTEFETVVVDLIEDLYVWAEDEFCKREGIIHIGDYKSMGAGYSVVRKEFFAQISKLLSIDKHVILVSHEADKIGKTKAGADTYTYIPSDKMSLTKQWNDIEGQVRYFLRCYSQEEEAEGRLIKKRYLSLVPGSNEYGISRGLDEATCPREIELDWNTFVSVIGLDTPRQTTTVEEPEASPTKTRKPRISKKVEEVEEKPTVHIPTEDPQVVTEDPEVVETEVVEVETVVEPEVKEVAPAQEEPVDTSKLTAEERRRIVAERIAKMKGGNK